MAMSVKTDHANINNPLPCQVKGPVHIHIGDHKEVEFHAGCAIIDITFPSAFYLEIGEIHFKNFYTATLTVKFKGRKPTASDEAPWKTCIRRMSLMPRPHCHTGAEDYFIVNSKQMLCPVQNVTCLRLILRQPSPVWRDFSIEDIKLYKSPSQAGPDMILPSWVVNPQKPPVDQQDRQLKGVSSVPALSAELQKMWAATVHLAEANPSTKLGRSDVDGSYEINLLSYT